MSCSDFEYLCTPGKTLFYVHSATLAPEMNGVPAQIFVGQWNFKSDGCDIAVYEIETGKWDVISFPDVVITSYLCVDPYRPCVFMNSDKDLYEIDRRTLEFRKVAPLSMKYIMDFDRQGRLWLNKARSFYCYDPETERVTEYADITPEKYFYSGGTHTRHCLALDGRIWLTQSPIPHLSVFDPEKGTCETVLEQHRNRPF